MTPMLASAWVRDLWAPDEPRYAQVARESFELGSFLVMRRCGVVYPDKPPLLFWSSGFSGWLGGWSELWMRIPTLISIAIIAIVLARLARMWWGHLAAIWAPAVFLSFAMVTEIGGRLQIDPLLTMLCVAALYVDARPATTSRERRRHLLIAAVFVGIAGLAKGPIAIVNVGLVLAAWEWVRPRTEISRVPWHTWLQALAIALLPSVCWAVAAAIQEPGLFRSLFFEEHVGRLTRPDRHPGKPWKNLVRMPLLMLPWTALVIAELARVIRSWRSSADTRSDGGARMAASWLVVLFVFYSVIPTKRDLYLLPAYPAAALLAARSIVRSIRSQRLGAWAGLTGPVVLCLVALGLILAPHISDEMPELTSRAPFVGAPMLAGAVAAVVLFWKQQIRGWAITVTATWFVFASLAALLVFPPLNSVKSARTLALEIASLPQKPPEIPCLGDVRPDGFRFYGGVPTVRDNDKATRDRIFVEALDRYGSDFLGLITEKRLERVPEHDRRRLRVVMRREVGDKKVVVVTAAVD